ncbi:TlpA disulfide reductase family protein [Haloarchaeobius sp. HME9146]|uniref:TlpA family protein disulfide reductase n=1 Tax=Haloarchaeobius sp. HME9146 TaxID=2978732 RepID=UPI0021C039A9|nr:TlpA disulfide reductase family protein [Haloarchaeobius sp. HME9146]MCT9096253.1 TlpA family protein disulfide reductase [Haloarchaeobius sp. HME9146]
MDSLSRRDALRLAGLGTVGLAGCLSGGGTDDTGTDGGGGSDTAWEDTELTNVLTGETFTVSQFDKPVLVETFAVWCSNCKRQQDELIEFHEAVGDDVVSVALNIDQNEDAEKVRNHAESHGYDWYYAVSPPAVTRQIVDEFGTSMTSPPIVPMLLRCSDGTTTRLKDGHKETSFLREKANGC